MDRLLGRFNISLKMCFRTRKVSKTLSCRRYNLRLCWQTPVCQILVRDGEPPKLGFKGPISLVAAAGTFFGKLIQ